jgi:hypothetical protein
MGRFSEIFFEEHLPGFMGILRISSKVCPHIAENGSRQQNINKRTVLQMEIRRRFQKVNLH